MKENEEKPKNIELPVEESIEAEEVFAPHDTTTAEAEETNNDEQSAKTARKKAFKQIVSNDEEEKVEMNFYTFLGGEFIAHLLRKQIKFVLLLTLLTIAYITNRYAFQNEIVENKRLTEQLEDRRLRAIVATSNLVEYTRRSNVQEELPDTTLKQSNTPHRYLKIGTKKQ